MKRVQWGRWSSSGARMGIKEINQQTKRIQEIKEIWQEIW